MYVLWVSSVPDLTLTSLSFLLFLLYWIIILFYFDYFGKRLFYFDICLAQTLLAAK